MRVLGSLLAVMMVLLWPAILYLGCIALVHEPGIVMSLGAISLVVLALFV